MRANKRISDVARNTVMASMNAAANPNAENPLVVIRTLEQAERNIVEQSSPAYMQLFSGIGTRGKLALMMDSELDSLIAQEGDE